MNWQHEDEIGEYLSALSNGACLKGEKYGYLVFGIKDGTHTIEGTSFKPKLKKVKGESLESFLATRLNPKVDFEIHEFVYEEKHLAIFRIMAANAHPISYNWVEWIRVGEHKRKLRDFPEKSRQIWANTNKIPFEKEIAKENVSPEDIVNLLDTQAFFQLLKISYPSNRERVIEKLEKEKLITRTGFGLHITNLGAILFAKNLTEFEGLKRKAIRVNQYEGKNKFKTLKDQEGVKGYAVGFFGLIEFINNLLPSNEEIGPVSEKLSLCTQKLRYAN
jgi:ATP-dependent DNA helicase RecG